MAPFCRQASSASRLQSHFEEEVLTDKALKMQFFQNWAWGKVAQNFKDSYLGDGARKLKFSGFSYFNDKIK